MKKKWNIRIQFSSLFEMQQYLPAIIDEVRAHGCLSDDRTYELKLILSELSINALQHGMPPICIIAGKCCCGDIHILVSHEYLSHQSFDPCNYFQTPPSPESERGRGIFLAHSLADGLAYNQSATKALLKVRCEKTG